MICSKGFIDPSVLPVNDVYSLCATTALPSTATSGKFRINSANFSLILGWSHGQKQQSLLHLERPCRENTYTQSEILTNIKKDCKNFNSNYKLKD